MQASPGKFFRPPGLAYYGTPGGVPRKNPGSPLSDPGLCFSFSIRLFTKTKLLDKCTILVDVCLLEVLKETTSLTNHLKQTAT